MINNSKLDLGPLHDFYELGHAEANFLPAVIEGLSLPQKQLSSKYFYDQKGSDLFEQITRLPEYYPTRTEISLLKAHAKEFAELIGPGASLIEFGSGSSNKVRIILDALQEPSAYLPIDISKDYLIESAKDLARSYPDLIVIPISADYTRPLTLPVLPSELVRVGFFPGSTIGNFSRDEAIKFLRTASIYLGAGNGLLIGVDLKKDTDMLFAAYDDAAGVTARFNLNILSHINRELGADLDLEGFKHEVRWEADKGSIEMHLVSKYDQKVNINGHIFQFVAGESIHTEDSHKYTIETFQSLAEEAGWRSLSHWTDSEDLFSVHYLQVI